MIGSAATSLETAFASTALVAVTGTLAGFALARSRSRWCSALEVLFTLPLVFPPTLTGYYLLVLLGRHGLLGTLLHSLFGLTLAFSLAGAIIAAAVVSFPLMVISARAAFEGIDPDLEKAALTLGRSRSFVFFRVALPLAWRGLAAGAVLSFARALGEFGATLMVAGNVRTLPIEIYRSWLSGGIDSALPFVAVHTSLAVSVIGLAMLLRGRRERKLAGN